MKHWYVLRSKPKKEPSSAALLAKAGVEVYVPQITVTRHSRRAVLEPFFPGYLFSQLDPSLGEIRLASYTPGILYVLGYDGQPCPVPDELVLSIRQRLVRNGEERPLTDFRPGERLVITGGPLRDFEVILDSPLSAAGRARVLVQLVNGLFRAQLHAGQLRRANQAAVTSQV